MKKVLIGLVVLYLLFILSVIVRENRKKDYELNSNPEITITLVEDTLTPTSVTVRIQDVSPKQNGYSSAFILQKYKEDNWQEVDPKQNIRITAPRIYYVDENHELFFTYKWEEYYGELEQGRYRLLNPMKEEGASDTTYLALEFTIA